MNLGRFQPGQVVNISIQTVDSFDLPATPDAAPVAKIRDSLNAVVFSGKMAMDGSTKVFSLSVFVGISYPLGTYTVSYQWVVGGFHGTGSDTFDVIHGGDVGGRIISMYAYDRPEARYVVAQLTSGNVVQGRNPRL
jgi:hypothetical protein